MGLFRRKDKQGPEPVAAPPAAEPVITYGAPGKCPDCGAFGYVDVIDVVNRFQSQHCPACQTTWEFHFDADGHLLPDAAAQDAGVVDVRDGRTGDPGIDSLRPR